MCEDEIHYRDFPKIDSAERLSAYLKNRVYDHSKYCHYTDLRSIDSILRNKQFWLSDCHNFNDKKEIEQFANKKSKFYSICFSTGINENLSLWYMYGGLEGKGGRIRFTKSFFKKLILNAKYSLHVYEDGKLLGKICELNNNKLIVKDILYARKKDGTYDLKYNNLNNYNKITHEVFEEFKKNNIGFIKHLVWYYEKETRVLLELPDSFLEELNKDKDYKIVMSFDENIYKNIHIDLAPEVTDLLEETTNYPDLQKFMQHTSRLQPSEHQGQVKMNLCSKCPKENKQ